jgi:hypothetical protein
LAQWRARLTPEGLAAALGTLNRDARERLQLAFAEGATVREAARAAGCSHGTAGKYRPGRSPRRRLGVEVREKLRESLTAGLTVREAAAAAGCSVGAVYKLRLVEPRSNLPFAAFFAAGGAALRVTCNRCGGRFFACGRCRDCDARGAEKRLAARGRGSRPSKA